MRIALFFLVAASIAAAVVFGDDMTEEPSALGSAWQQSVSPGALSRPHASMSNNCAACHAPIKGVESARCIVCHANDTALLQRQPTAFHASIQTCGGCHMEHRGGERMPTTMDHALLAKEGHKDLKVLPRSESAFEGTLRAQDIETLSAAFDKPGETPAALPGQTAPAPELRLCGEKDDCTASQTAAVKPAASDIAPLHPGMSADESMLNCATCHQTKDRHQGMFRTDCAQCHATESWKIADFRHPSTRSTECAQCHKPPPSHNMMHFSMVSARVAGQYGAKVNQCYLCHQTTSWNDIRDKGWYKHH